MEPLNFDEKTNQSLMLKLQGNFEARQKYSTFNLSSVNTFTRSLFPLFDVHHHEQIQFSHFFKGEKKLSKLIAEKCSKFLFKEKTIKLALAPFINQRGNKSESKEEKKDNLKIFFKTFFARREIPFCDEMNERERKTRGRKF